MVDQIVDGTMILAVDDDDMNLEMLDVILSSADCRIIKAGNGREAVRLLDVNTEIDVILVDLEMPVMDGYELINYVKQSLKYRLIPVVVMTGNSIWRHRPGIVNLQAVDRIDGGHVRSQ